MRLPRPRALLRAAACAALLVLALGLPRLLVLCEHGDGNAALAFRHAPGTCCHEHAAADAVGGDHDGGSEVHEDRRCAHTGLLVELLPAPRADAVHAPDAPPARLCTTPSAPRLPALRAVPRPPPATGPPRADRRTELRAATVLIV